MPKYLANTNTKEIHKLSNTQPNCKLTEISPQHKKYLEYDYEVNILIMQGYNGCYWCFREKHTG